MFVSRGRAARRARGAGAATARRRRPHKKLERLAGSLENDLRYHTGRRDVQQKP